MSDVCAAAAIAAAEGGIAGIVGVAVGIANHAIHPIVHLKAGNAGGLSRKLGFDVGVYAVNRPLGFAAALRHLALDAVAGLHDGHVGAVLRQSHLLAELANVALHLVAKIADAVSDVGQAVVDLSKLLAKQNLLLAGGGGILPELTLTIPAISAKAEMNRNRTTIRNQPEPQPFSSFAPRVTAAISLRDIPFSMWETPFIIFYK